MTLQDERLVRTQQKQELENNFEQESPETGAKKEIIRQKPKLKQILIWLPKRPYGQFVAWKGNWGKGRAFVVSETGASVKNRGGGQFLISGDEIAVQRAINMIVTQSLTAVASSNDYNIMNQNKHDKKQMVRSQKKRLLKEALAKPKSSGGGSRSGASDDKKC